MNSNALKKIFLFSYRGYFFQKRRICDFLGSLKVNKYSNSSNIIRIINDDDLDRILEIYEKSFGNKNYGQIIKYSHKFRNIFYVYEIDGVIIGYLGFYVHLQREGFYIIQKATAFSGAVDEKMRGKGIFSTLYGEALSNLNKNNVKTVYGYVNTQNACSLAVHYKFGFKIIETIKNIYELDDSYKVELKLHS